MTLETHLHLPDEPVIERAAWLDAVNGGVPFSYVLEGSDGIAEWLWTRWRAVSADGVTLDQLRLVTLSSRREIWLWLVGERSWNHAASSVLGRLSRS